MSEQETDKRFWMAMREAHLSIVNEIEIKLGIFPTTSQIRKEFKKAKLPATPELVDVIVNGKVISMKPRLLAYAEVVALAFPDAPVDVLFTVTYSAYPGVSGTMSRGDSLTLSDNKLIFNVANTSKA